MGNMGTIPATGYESSVVQTFSSPTGTSHTMTYTASVNDMILVINNVIQEPTVAYTTSGTTLTTGTLISGDTMYIVYLALTRQTVAPGADTVTNAMIVDNAINSEHYTDGSIDLAHMSVNSIDSDQYVDASIDNAHLADDAVGVDELSATGTASSSTFLRGDNAWAAAASVATGFIGGLTISNNGSDAAHDIDIAVGSARDYTDAVTMTQGTAALTKRIDATWVVGDGNGGLDSTDTVGANTGYGVYLIRRSDTGVVDVLISSDMTAAGSALTMPTNYDQKRLIGWVRTNAASNIFTFIQSGNYFRIMTAGTIYELYDSSITNNTYETFTTTTPPLCEIILYCMVANGSTTDNHMSMHLRTKGANESAANSSEAFMSVQQHDDMDLITGFGNVLVDGSSEMEYSCTESTGAANMTLTTIGCVMHTRSNP